VADQGIQWFFDAIIRYGIEAIVAVIVVFFLLKFFLPSYLSEKGKNLATREDFHTLLEQLKKTTQETESIKVELSTRHWLNQQQWSIREKRYAHLLSNLTKLRLSLQDRNNHFLEPGSEHNESLSESEHFEELSRVGYESLRSIREQIGPASVFLSDKTIKALEELVREYWSVAEFSICTADYVSSALDLVDAAYSAVLAEARNELARQKDA
jgi:hypothetical protein